MAGGTKARRVGGRALGRDGTEDAGWLKRNARATKRAHPRRPDAAPLQVRRKIVRSCSASPPEGSNPTLNRVSVGWLQKKQRFL
jgi:hypothetical protein